MPLIIEKYIFSPFFHQLHYQCHSIWRMEQHRRSICLFAFILLLFTPFYDLTYTFQWRTLRCAYWTFEWFCTFTQLLSDHLVCLDEALVYESKFLGSLEHRTIPFDLTKISKCPMKVSFPAHSFNQTYIDI